MMTLYQIGEEQKELLAEIENNEGEITTDLAVKMNLLAENIEEKAVAYGFVIKQFEGEESLIDAEIKRLQELKKAKAKTKDYLKERISAALIEFGIEKVETPLLKLSFRKSESVEIVDEALLAPKYFSYSPKIDKTEIKNSIKNGEEVSGARIVSNLNLQVK